MKKPLWISLVMIALGATVGGCTLDDTYATCFEDADCNDLDDLCYELTLVDLGGAVVTDGASCTHGCSSDLDCESNFGFAGACYAVGGPGFPQLCYQTCEFDEDCYSRNRCIEAVLPGGFFDFICVPDNF
jgi:hypothetical protein